MNLTEFLLARIAEDEAAARVTLEEPDPLDWGDLLGDAAWHMHGPVDGPSGYASLVVDPARVLAECEAKRRIVALHAVGPEEWGMGYDPDDGSRYGTMTSVCRTCGTSDEYGVRWPCDTIRAFALPYADHPDYRDEWRPTT